jgi:hypothetical protein
LRNALKRQFYARGLKVPREAFIFRNNTYRGVLDEHILYKLAKARTEGKLVEVRLPGRRNKESAGKENWVKIVPAYLKIDLRLGRWYLFALRDGNPAIIRLSSIERVKVLSEGFDIDEACERIDGAFEYSYISKPSEETQPVLVEAELLFGEAPWLKTQFEREIFIGEIIERDGRELYRVMINDTSEVKPFLRSYCGYVRVLPGEHTLDTEISEEFKRMGELYGTV